MKPANDGKCSFCLREVELSFHHFIPKKTHSKRLIKKRYEKDFLDHYGCWTCNDCHKMIHKLFSHDELAMKYNSLELISRNTEMIKFIEWVKKQDKRVKR